MDGMAKLFNLQEGMQVTCSALVVLVTAVFFLSRRRSNKGNLAGKDHAKGKDAEDIVVEEDYAAEAEDVVTELDIPPETRGTFSLVEKSLQKKKGRDPTASMMDSMASKINPMVSKIAHLVSKMGPWDPRWMPWCP